MPDTVRFCFRPALHQKVSGFCIRRGGDKCRITIQQESNRKRDIPIKTAGDQEKELGNGTG